MRVLFLGTPDFAVPALEALVESSDFEVAGVITQPDRKGGRGLRLLSPPVKSFAKKRGIQVLQPERIRNNPSVREFLETLRPAISVVVAFGQILPEDFFSFPEFGTLNVHASILPAYRGAAPIIHALRNGEPETGVTIMKIDAGMDTGDILDVCRVSIEPHMTAGTLAEILAEEGARLLIPTMRDYVQGRIQPVPQDHSRASYAPRLKKEDARISWDLDAQTIHNLVRAMNPWPGAECRWREEALKLWSTEVAGPDYTGGDERAGSIIKTLDDGVVVRCSMKTALKIKELQLPNRKRTSARSFVHGHHVEVGELLT